MKEAVSAWMGAVVAAALLSALVQTVTEGTMRRVASLVGGLVLLSVLLRPAAQWTETVLPPGAETAELFRQEVHPQSGDALEVRIAELTAAYISDKAAELALSCEASVEVRKSPEGVPLPWSAALSCGYSAELAQWMARELDIPEERQVWNGAGQRN